MVAANWLQSTTFRHFRHTPKVVHIGVQGVYTPGVQPSLGLPRRTTTMMAWILVALLASVASDAVVSLSPETNAAPTLSFEGGGLPPKP